MRVGGIVLAGGRSTRMGTAKADLDWHGVPLVVHVARTVAAALNGPVLVVAAPEQRLPAQLDVVRDRVAHRGPLQGLAAGLAALEADVAFVCATDQPFAARAVPRLLAALTDADDAVAVRGQPLGAIYRTSVAAIATERLTGADRSLKGLLQAIAVRELEPTTDDLRSLDTPAAYAAALRSSAARGC